MDERPRTIVGGRSAVFRNRGDYPRGIEILLKKAKVDPEFQQLFLQSPVAAAESIGLELSENEKKMLAGTTRQALQVMVSRAFVPKHHVSTFLTRNVPAMLALAIASTAILTGTDADAQTKGISGEDQSEAWQEVAGKQIAMIQNALEEYRNECGRYPATEEWLKSENPLREYVSAASLYDPWKRRFHYQAVKRQGRIVGYKLESLGPDISRPDDNILCPIGTEEHRFPGDKPLSILPSHGPPQRLPLRIDLTKMGGKPLLIRAEHTDGQETVEWYLDGLLVSSTSKTHELLLDMGVLSPGGHVLLLADGSGHSASLPFEISR